MKELPAVHPRLRGELVPSDPTAVILNGSSPLTRGTHLSCEGNRSQGRFIPAYAGNSTSSSNAQISSPVHPRLRGELCVNLTNCISNVRFIPAYAGNSSSAEIHLALGSVHPRLRGELFNSPYILNTRHGSSPLTRGTHIILMTFVKFNRFIPAYAGNSEEISQTALRTSVHPRLRGEL